MYQGGATFLPLRVNQAGVIPIIFAVSILLFPTQIASYFATPARRRAQPRQSIADGIVGFLSPQGIPYIAVLLPADVGFTYFYTAFTFKPDETADQLRKNGGFIPGIRPGAPTRDYLAEGRVPHQPGRCHLPGASWRSRRSSCRPSFPGSVVRRLRPGRHGAPDRGLVVVETMKQLEAQLMMRNYEGFIR